MTRKHSGIFNLTIKAALSALKREFRRWYGTISVKELAGNRELAAEIAILEQMLANQGV